MNYYSTRRSFVGGTVALMAGAARLAAAKGVSGRDEVRPSMYTTDVLVVGGGPAGVCSAIAAARNGADVLVVEQGNCLGGMGTQGLVGPFMTCYDKSGKVQVIRGLFDEIVRRMVAIGGAIHPSGVRDGASRRRRWRQRRSA